MPRRAKFATARPSYQASMTYGRVATGLALRRKRLTHEYFGHTPPPPFAAIGLDARSEVGRRQSNRSITPATTPGVGPERAALRAADFAATSGASRGYGGFADILRYHASRSRATSGRRASPPSERFAYRLPPPTAISWARRMHVGAITGRSRSRLSRRRPFRNRVDAYDARR